MCRESERHCFTDSLQSRKSDAIYSSAKSRESAVGQGYCKVRSKACAEEKSLWFSYGDSQRIKRIERISTDHPSQTGGIRLYPLRIQAYLSSAWAPSNRSGNHLDCKVVIAIKVAVGFFSLPHIFTRSIFLNTNIFGIAQKGFDPQDDFISFPWINLFKLHAIVNFSFSTPMDFFFRQL